MSKWKPIETAPKDGTVILAAMPLWRPNEWEISAVKYCDISNIWRLDVCPFQCDDDWCVNGPTHWMPLPEPPGREG